MGKPAELGKEDIEAIRELAQRIYDGVDTDTLSPYDVIVHFSIDRKIPIETLLLLLAQGVKHFDDEHKEMAKLLDEERDNEYKGW